MKTHNFPPNFTTDYNISNTWVNGVWYLRIWYDGNPIADCLTEEEVHQKTNLRVLYKMGVYF
jgi:hypothetical protein